MSVMYRIIKGAVPRALLPRLSQTKTWASFATAALDEYASNQTSTNGQRTFISNSVQLSAESIGSYYTLDHARLPEAGRSYASAFYAPRDAGHERRGGCKALQQEVKVTGVHAVMYRPVMHTLFDAVGARGPASRRLLLTGPPGVGKSIALVSLVEWARQQGWLVLYVPSCTALVQGGYFSRRGDSCKWDTLTSAQQLLKGVLDAHEPQLKELPVQQLAAGKAKARRGGPARALPAAPAPAAATGAEAAGRTLHDLVSRGLTDGDNAELAVESVLELVRQLAAASRTGAKPLPVLFALDDYNCLYGETDYGWYSPSEDPRTARRRLIKINDLVLASSLRLLDAGQQQLGGAAVVAATCTALPLPAPAAPPVKMPYTELPVPGFSEAETRNALAHYHATGYARSLATSRQARQLHALTQGNPRELRVNASTLGLQLS